MPGRSRRVGGSREPLVFLGPKIIEKGPNVYGQGLREEAAAINTQAGRTHTHRTGFSPLLFHLGVTPVVGQDPTIS